MDLLPERLSLFPLQLVLLPGELLPLHIFEERYKKLVSRCLEDGEPFGVVLRLGDGVAAVGCLARLVAVLEEFPDGRSNIVVRGGTPFRILAIDVPDDADEEPLGVAVEYLEEEPDEASGEEPAEERAEEPTEASEPADLGEVDTPDAPTPLSELLRRFEAARGGDEAIGDEAVAPVDDEALADAEALAGEDAFVDEDGGEESGQTQRSYRIAADLDFEIGLRQRLLESRSESERVALITGYLETLIPKLELIESRREAIRGNGKGD